MQITAEQLLNLGACEYGVADFRTAFPNGFAPKSKAAAVRMCGRASHLDFDWASRRLLNDTAGDAYEEAKAQALDACRKAMAQAWDAYRKATIPSWDACKKAKAQAWDTYEKAKAQAFARAWWNQEHS